MNMLCLEMSGHPCVRTEKGQHARRRRRESKNDSFAKEAHGGGEKK